MSLAGVTGGENREIRFWQAERPAELDPFSGVNHGVTAWVNHVRDRQWYRRDLDVLHMCLYGTDPTLSYGVQSYALSQNSPTPPLTFNVVRAVVETLVSRMAKAKPKPWAQTSGASWKLQREAKKLTKYAEGCFYEQKFFALRRRILTDSAVLGTGAVKVYDDDGEPCCERTFIPELFISDDEAKYGDDGAKSGPRTIVQVKTIDKYVAAELWAGDDDELKGAILSAKPARDDGLYAFSSTRDQIDIFEAWHLPTSAKSGDGRHIICFENCVVLDEAWGLKGRDGRPRFPFALLRYSKNMTGWYGTGLARLLMGKQLEISKLLFEIQRSFHLGSNFRILVERGSRIIKSHFNNEIGSILEYTGTAPVLGAAQTVHPEKFNHLLWLIKSSFEEAGINQLSAAGMKDPTLKSGRAQEVAMDVEDSRYADFCQADEEFVLDAAELLVETAREAGRDRVVMYTGGRHVETLKLGDIDLKRDQYVLAMYPTSALASAPDRRMEQVQNLLNGGMVTSVRDARRLLGFPDLEDQDELDQAAYDLTRKWIEDIVDEGKYHAPIPMMDLDLALSLAVNSYLYVETLDDIPNDHKELLLQFIAAVGDLKGLADQPPPAAMPGMAGPQLPQAGGAPPPVPPAGAPAGATLQ